MSGVDFNLLSIIEILLMFVTLCFPWAVDISSAVTKANTLLLITPLKVFSLLCRYALLLVVWKLFILKMISACLWLSTSMSKFLFSVFLMFWGVALVAITFSIEKGENLARQTSSKDSMTMNLRKSAASFSESDSDKFL